jgi:hypothetical protein
VSAYDSWAQRIKGNPVNLIDKIRVNVVADFNSGSCVSTPGATLRICVWKSVGNAPGPLIAAYPVTPIVSDPGWNEVVIPGGLQVLGDFFIGYDITLFGASEFIWATFQRDGDAGPCKPIKDGAWVHRKATVSFPNEWWNRPTNPNITQPDNLVAEVDFCAIPLSERACVTENDWPTFQHDFARTGASGTAVGSDAYCDLTLNWKSIRPTGRAINLNGPIIWNGYVICAFSAATAGSYVIFNLATGAIVDEIKDATWGGDNSVIGGNIRCTPTVATIGGNPVLLIVGGNPGSVSAFNLTGGFPLAVPASKMWTFTAGGTIGATRYGNIIVQNIGGTDVVFVAADDNKVYAINGLTGASYGGWASPYTLTFNPQKAGATDGTDLFYSMFNPSGNSKITAIKASNGTMDWEFTGLQGASLFTGVTQETFEAGVSTADGEVYANSRILDGTSNVANLSRGVFYRLNASTGAMLSAVAGERARTTTPVIDARRVIVTTLPRVTGASATGGQVTGFTRIDGALDFSTSSYFSAQNGGQMGYFIEGLLTCEPDSADFFYAFNIAGYLSCFNADNGRERYHRRIDHAGANQGGMGAIGKDGTGDVHLVFVDAFGSIYDMTKQSPRPRLELLSGGKAQAVPFGSLPSTIVTFPKMYTNTGCTNLLVSLKASTTSNGTTVPAPGFSTINSRLDRNSSSMADMLSFGAEDLYNQTGDVKRLGVDRFSGSTDELPSYDNVRQTYNQSAAAVPAFLNQVGGSYVGDVFVPPFGNIVTAPGDTAAIKVDVNGPLVNRGPNSFYIEYSIINDPDYYLDNPARRPELFMSLVGGCLPDTTALHFGTGGANYQWVSNTGRFGTADWSPDGVLVPYSIKIDGVVDGCFAGTYAYAVSDRRIAVNAVDWISGSTENESWISMQGDPNFCDASCKPALQTGVALPAISTDGITYTPIIANVVCKSYIDSVQNFDDGAGGWDWELYISAPFDNDSTMGLKANTKTYGIPNGTGPTALLNNMTLEIMTFTERNGNAVPGWKIGMWSDNDVRVYAGGPRDTTLRSAAYSAAWASSVSVKTAAAGWIKVPFGCGYSPLKNALAMNQRQGMYPQGAAQIKWDSVYKYMSRPAGLYSQNLTLSADDQNSFYTFDEHDFGPSGSHKVGLAFFLFTGMTDSHSATADNKINKLAILLNQLSGFGRGDVNNDGVVNLADIVYLASNVSYGGPGPIPFVHLGDVNLSGGAPTIADVTYLVNYYFSCGPCPMGEFVL